ncbi:MAG: hypothetical protein JJU02_04260 [Cryomorphaceae bacterium]|nr:hypothetical protein [Cryomorphaceae bacterium]
MIFENRFKKIPSAIVLVFAINITISCGGGLAHFEKLFQMQDQVEDSLSSWIRHFALYPESYRAISFSEFSPTISTIKGVPVPESEVYIIKHQHEILDIDSNLQVFSGYFLLNYQFDVTLIEINRSQSLGGAFPPRTEVWMEKFGRPLTASDSIAFLEKQQALYKKTTDMIKEAKESGKLKDIDDQEIINHLDELIRESESRKGN